MLSIMFRHVYKLQVEDHKRMITTPDGIAHTSYPSTYTPRAPGFNLTFYGLVGQSMACLTNVCVPMIAIRNSKL